ncbi:hypothetical protein D3C87_1408080 [compost metagenome]
MHDADLNVLQRPATGGERYGLRMGRLDWREAIMLEGFAIDEKGSRCLRGRTCGHGNHCFGQAIRWHHAVSAQTLFAKGLKKAFNTGVTHRFGAHNAASETAEVERISVDPDNFAYSDVECEIRNECIGGAVSADRRQPDRRATHKVQRRHKYGATATDDREQDPTHQAEVMIKRGPGDHRTIRSLFDLRFHFCLDHPHVGNDVAMTQDDPLGP